ncbi:aminotransferase class V-fold PLP-dependent enzyme [Bacteroidota bacterium]
MDSNLLVKSVSFKESKNGSSHIFNELERGVHSALKTYSNVERGSGHYSQVTTALYEKARIIVLDHMKLDKKEYVVIFCTPYRAGNLKKQITSENFHIISSKDIGLSIGIIALAVKKKKLPKGIPSQTGGGMIKLVSPRSLVLADVPERFEAGTPGIINIITFTKALQLIDIYGENAFRESIENTENSTAAKILYLDNLLDYTRRELLMALRRSMLDRYVRIPIEDGHVKYTNLDNGASTPPFSPVWETVRQTWKQTGYIKNHIVSNVKEICAGFLSAPNNLYETIFCSNTTEAINIAAQNLELEFIHDSEPVILNTLLEHHSNELPWRYMPNTSLIRLAVDNNGFVNMDELEQILNEYNHEHRYGKKRIRIVAISGASNVLGSFNDIRSIAQITHKYNARILVDGAQLVAHRKISMEEDGIDYLAFSGHKMYAPFGSGVLLVKKELVNFYPNELEKIKSSGEENVIGIAAIGKAINLLQRIGMDVIKEEERKLTSYALQGLSKIPGIIIFGIQDSNSLQFSNKGGIVIFSLKKVPHNLVAKELAENGGIGVRTGCFCAHLIVKHLMKIHPLRGFAAEVFLKLFPELPTSILPGVVRISIGLENDEQDIDHFLEILREIANAPRSLINRFIASIYNGTLLLPHTRTQKQMEEFTKTIIDKVYSNKLSFQLKRTNAKQNNNVIKIHR